MELIHKCQGKPWNCICSTGETAFALAFTIINNIPQAEVMLAFPDTSRQVAAMTNEQEKNDGSDLEAERLVRKAEHLI